MWVWQNTYDEPGSLFTMIDYGATTLDESRLTGSELIGPEQGAVVINAKRYKSTRILKHDYIDCAGPFIVVGERAKSALAQFEKNNQLQFYPVTINTRDGSLAGYYAVVVLNKRLCVDLDKSAVTYWTLKNVRIGEYDSLVFLDRCMDGLDIVRDKLSGECLVSDKFKVVIEEAGLKHFNFRSMAQMAKLSTH